MKILILALILAPTTSFATLGQNRLSVKQDIQTMGAEPILAAQSLSAHPEVHVDGINFFGQIIKEYSDSSGQVFAITWKGKGQPDLRPLLANYFAEFKRLEDATPKGRRFLRKPYVTSEITVVRAGHLEDIHGIAFVNGHLPTGINLDELQ